ncbi:MAG: putative HAF family extracellular repeat protein [Bacteroidia bacterium]|jgi:probable HAF family extracellular repeat protein
MKRFPSLIGGLVLLPSLASIGLAWGDQPYEYTDLGDLGGGESVAFGLNDVGQVVGWSTLAGCTTSNGAPCRRAFLWQGGLMIDLGKLPGDEESFARAINNSGTIVGTSESDIIAGSGTFHAVSWNWGVITPLPDLGKGTSFVHDINESGQMIGHSRELVSDRDHVAIWNGGVVTDLGANESHTYNRGHGINDAGDVVGFAWNLFQPNDSIQNDGAWKVIGGEDSPWQNSEAMDINNAGHRVGYQAFPSGSWHGAMWMPGDKSPIDAGLLPGMSVGELHDVNESGLAVGSSYEYGPPFLSRATSFDGTTLVDLNDHMPAGSSATLFEAREVNENGDIAGTATVNGLFRAFLLTRMEQWKHLGTALAGDKKAPELEGFGSLTGGTSVELQIANTPPGAAVFLAAGVSQLNVPFFGGVLTPNPDFLFPLIIADGAGEATRSFPWPTGILPGVSTYWQAWVIDPTGPQGVTSTDAVTQVTK